MATCLTTYTTGGRTYLITVSGTVPNCPVPKLVVLTQDEYISYQNTVSETSAPIDYDSIGSIWAFSFMSVIILGFAGVAIGKILYAIKSY